MKYFIQFSLLVVFLALTAPFAAAQETGGVKGKVRGPKGEALAGVKVTARLKGEDVRTVRTDSKGNFELGGLRPGVYNFVFEKSGYGTALKADFEVKANKTQSLGDRLFMTVDQGTLVLIRGSVFDQNGRSITGAKVEIERINSDGSTKKIGTVFTNVSGEFAFRQPEGAAQIRVTAAARGASASKEIAVDSAGIYRLAVTLNLEKEKN